MSSYDVIIIGSGAGGGTLAHRLAPSGKRILLIVGGITLLLGQVVPLWLGRSLLDDADAMDNDGATTPEP